VWMSKQLGESSPLSPEKGEGYNMHSHGGTLHRGGDLLSSVIPPLTPRSRPGSRAASPERGGGGGLLMSQTLGRNLTEAAAAARGKRMTTPLPKKLNRSAGGSGGPGSGVRGEDDEGMFQENSVDHEYLVAAAKSIPNEYGTRLASYLVRRPYIASENEDESDALVNNWSTYPHLSAREGYLACATAFDPNSLEILAFVEADGSVFTLTGKSDARHGRSRSGGRSFDEDSSSLDWAIFDNVEEMDRALGKLTYIDAEGNESEYWLDSIYEEALTTRESYCMSMISAAFALKEVTGSMMTAAQQQQQPPQTTGASIPMQQQPPQMMQPPAQPTFQPMHQPSSQLAGNFMHRQQQPQQNAGVEAIPLPPEAAVTGSPTEQTQMPPIPNPQTESSKPCEPATTVVPKEPNRRVEASTQQTPSKLKEKPQAKEEPSSKAKEEEKKKNSTKQPSDEEFEPADSALPFMVMSLCSFLFYMGWFFIVKVPLKIGCTIFKFVFTIVALRVLWLFLADDGGAWEMGAGIDWEYNMPGIY